MIIRLLSLARCSAFTVGILSGLVLSAQAAGTGSQGEFTIHNNTEINVIVGFYTDDGTGWSANWLDENIGPEEMMALEFIDNEGSCEQKLRVGWLAEGGGEVLDEPIAIDICDASNLYLQDNEIYYD